MGPVVAEYYTLTSAKNTKGETMKLILGFAIAIIFLASCAAQYQPGEQYGSLGDGNTPLRPRVQNQTEELGQVNWGRDLDDAKAMAAESGKPILVLFQEVPG